MSANNRVNMAISETQTDTATGTTSILGIVNFLSMIQDENALYNAYPAHGTSRIRSVARASSIHELCGYRCTSASSAWRLGSHWPDWAKA